MKKQIIELIKKIEKKENVRVVYLIESGSRAWGWESEDSDYDVRGVFIQDYQKFEEEKQQITVVVGDIDVVLWDLKKFFRLFIESNPSVWEWLSSDIVYLDNQQFNELKKIFIRSVNKSRLIHHYISMARQNFEKYINKTGDSANLKKYVYVLRSIACVNYIEKNNLPPPKNYREVIEYLPDNIRLFFEKLVGDKKKSERLEGKRSKEVEAYVTSFWKKSFKQYSDKFVANELEAIFKKLIK